MYLVTLNPIEKFKVAILHLNRNWNHSPVVAVNAPCLVPSGEYRSMSHSVSSWMGIAIGLPLIALKTLWLWMNSWEALRKSEKKN